MAQRYGGKFSPGGTSDTPVPTPPRSGDWRTGLLFVPPVVLLFFSLGSGALTLAVGLAGAAALTLGAWLTREGQKAEAEYNARKVARRPALPRKMTGAVLTGLGVGLAAATSESGTIASALYGAVATALHVVAFGIDPLRDKNVEGIDQFQQDRVARVVDEAEAYLDSMKAAISRANDRALTGRVERFTATVQRMFRTVEEDPRDLTGARRYLGVYLLGARDATVKYADLAERGADPEARASYEALLSDLEENFAAQTSKMLEGDRTDMDIEIKVLRDRLQREGVTTPE